MFKNGSYVPLAGVVLLGVLLQVVLIFSACSHAPHEAAIAFAEAYFKLDPDMAEYLCQESRVVDDTDTVQAYLFTRRQQARQRGFEKAFLKSKLYHVITHTTFVDDDSARVALSADRRTAINPAYAWVAKLFHIGGTYPLRATLDVVKEDGRWKVCGRPFDLIQDM